MTSTPFSQIDPRGIEWIWKKHLPAGMITALGGQPSRGKSLISFHAAAEVSHLGHVLISNHEDRLREIARPRIAAAGANMDRVHTFVDPLEAMPGGFERLAAEVERYNAKLVILDPLVSHVSGPVGNAAIIRRALQPLDRLCETTGLAVLIVTHQVKYASPYSDPLKTIGGANSGLAGMCRAVYLAGRNPSDSDQFVLANAKPLGLAPPSLSFELDVSGGLDDSDEPEAGFLHFQGECKVSASDLVEAQYKESEQEPKMTKAERAAEWLGRFLWEAKKPLKPSAVVAFAKMENPPITARQLRRAAQELGVTKPDANKGSTWELTAELREMLDAEYGEDRPDE